MPWATGKRPFKGATRGERPFKRGNRHFTMLFKEGKTHFMGVYKERNRRLIRVQHRAVNNIKE